MVQVLYFLLLLVLLVLAPDHMKLLHHHLMEPVRFLFLLLLPHVLSQLPLLRLLLLVAVQAHVTQRV
jgi:hypothetical protein